MFEDIEFDVNYLPIAGGMWIICLLLIWRFFDQEIMRLHVRILMTIVMAPICYFMTHVIANR